MRAEARNYISVNIKVKNQVGEIRKSRGLGASDLARRIGVSRQTIYAIEAGTYVPNTEVALCLAQELEVGIEELFSLHQNQAKPESIAADVLSGTPPIKGQPVRVCRIGTRWVSVPVSATPYYMPEADGVIERAGRSERADLVVFAKNEISEKKLVLAGCDPAANLLAQMVEKISGIEIVPAAASSKLALSWLKEGRVHVAGSHLEDPKTGEFNLPFLRKEFPDKDFSVITFAHWEEGLVVAPGNPKHIRKIDDLARKTVRFVNREPGSGSRALLDRLTGAAGIEPEQINGYTRIVYGHLAASYGVLSGDADVCLATRSAAQTFGLDFIPLHSERYDLVLKKRSAGMPAIQTFLDVLQRSALRRKLEVLAGYDTSQTGTLVV
ncbi:MAG TPA: substrate-binding domain-containing protein [Terriglobia bacterium]|jgi:molybdate-binding protein/DNA-binding XRE family transcriptional regulator